MIKVSQSLLLHLVLVFCSMPSPQATFRKTSGNVDFANGKRSKKCQASILPAICKAFGPTFLFGSILKLVNDVLTFVSPQILR